MKLASLITLKAAIILMFLTALPYDRQLSGRAQSQLPHMPEMMKDSSMVSMLMDSIASDRRMCMMMMQKMIHHAKADSAGMMQMCTMMTDDQEIHARLRELMNEQKHDGHSPAQEIIIKFGPGIKQAQVHALESEVGLLQIRIIPELNVRVFKITSSKSVNEVVALCERKPFVDYAEPNYQVKALKN